MIDTSGEWWRGEDFADLAEYVREYEAEGYPVATVTEAVCGCGGRTFRVLADDTEGAAQRTCVTCGNAAFIADSADYWTEAEPEECACPCGGTTFEVAVGFALRPDGEVRWLSIGLRCPTDGTLGVYADWKINYSPSTHLLTT